MSDFKDVDIITITNSNSANSDKFKISIDQSEASQQIKNLCKELFATDVLIINNLLDNNDYLKFFQIKQVKSILSNSDIIKTVEVFFENGMNTSVASVAGYMHRNTMVYRLQKIKKIIGLDIRNFNDAVLYYNMVTCYKILFNSL